MSSRNYGLISSIEELDHLARRILDGHGPVGFDIETGYHGPDTEKGALRVETNLLVGISFTDSLDWARYVPLGHDLGGNLDNYLAARIFWVLLSTGRGVAHNALFELRNLARWFREQLSDDPEFGAAVRASRGYFPVLACTQVESYLMAEFRDFATKKDTGQRIPQMRTCLGLKSLVDLMFGHKMTELHELFPGLAVNKQRFLRFNTLDPADPAVYNYACEDSLWCLAIHERYHRQVKDRLLWKVDMAVLPVIAKMADHGLRYDYGLMARAAEELREFQSRFNAEIMAELSEMVGEPVGINLGSWRQVGDVLYRQLGMVTTVYTPKTKDLPADQRVMSTGAIALAGLAKEYPVVKKMLQWKEMNKLLGSYLDKYERAYSGSPDGNVHANLSSALVTTGRFSCDTPNYQNCVPGSYEVLTPAGWRRFDELQDGEPVAQYHNNHTIDFIVPQVNRHVYDGDMIEIQSAENGTWRYTPNHRIVYRSRVTRQGKRVLSEMRECTAEQWQNQLDAVRPSKLGRILHDRYYAKAGYRTDGRRLSAEERRTFRLAIAVQADGSHTNGYQYDIAVSRSRKVEALRELGLEPVQQSGGRWRVCIPDDLIEPWLDSDKNFRAEPVLELCLDDLRWFVNEIMHWDGDSTRGATYCQHVKRRPSVDVVQAAAALVGYTTSLYEFRDYVTVNVCQKTHKASGIQEAVRTPSDGMVYCVTVPSGMFLCRNDQGKVLVTGNSPKTYHFDLESARLLHREHADAHGKDCVCDDPQFAPEPGTCWRFNFRDAIVAPPGHYILGFDLSQAELRAIAGEAQEQALLEAFANGEDVHTLTAALMLRIPVDEVTKEQRATGKTLNFALLYGMGAKSLADRLAISKEEAQQLFEMYFAAYPAIAVWSEKQVRFGKKNLYVKSKFGRRLPVWEFMSDKRWIYEKGERACVNYPIQGAATGDYVRIAMIRADKAITEAGLADKVHMVMNVHDALEFYVHESVMPHRLITVLEPAVIFPVPGWPAMAADWHIARKWGSPVEVRLDEHGRLLSKGKKVTEIVPVIEEDEETGEAELVFPDEDVQAVRAALVHRRESPTEEDTRTVVVELVDMPDAAVWDRFRAFLDERPGTRTVTVRTPEGELDMGTSSLDPKTDLAQVSLLLGSVRMHFDASTVDAAELVKGLAL